MYDKMSKLRKYTLLFSLFLFAVAISISVYLNVKSAALSKKGFAEYSKFMDVHSKTIGGEAHFSNDEDGKKSIQLLYKALNSRERRLSVRCADWSVVGFIISITSLLVGILLLTYNLLKRRVIWARNNPKKSILYFAVLFFCSSWIFVPFIHSGHIYYSFVLAPFWNGSRIFWALLLIEWTIVLLPLGLIYRRLSYKARAF